jgi:hypothetical protein
MLPETQMKSEDIYKLKVLRVLSSFQTLEFSLKIYVAAAYKLINRKLEGTIPFKYSFKDIENHPLEKLLNSFQKLNNNIELQKRLNKLREARNHIAHQALLVAHQEFRDLLDKDLGEGHESVISIEVELDDCLKLMALELEAVMSIYDENEA